MSEYNPCEWIIVGIAGATCAGKTSLANRLCAELAPVIVFHQDHYFYPDDSPHHVRCDSLDHNNYDILSALDMLSLRRDMLAALAGPGAGAGTGAGGGGGRRLMVVEGFCLLNFKPIADMCDLKYYLTLEEAECRARRALRLYEPPDVPGYFERCVWPEHLHYREEMKRDPSVRFASGADPDVLSVVLADIARLATCAAGPAKSAGRSHGPCVTVGKPRADTLNVQNAQNAQNGRDNGQAGHSRDEPGPPGCVAHTCDPQDNARGKQDYPSS